MGLGNIGTERASSNREQKQLGQKICRVKRDDRMKMSAFREGIENKTIEKNSWKQNEIDRDVHRMGDG